MERMKDKTFWHLEAQAEKITGKNYGELSLAARTLGLSVEDYVQAVVNQAKEREALEWKKTES